MKLSLVLASQSPRRKELLGHLNLPFISFSPDIDENSPESDALLLVQQLAQAKGQKVWDELKKRSDFGQTFFPVIVSADTVVVLENKILGKPVDHQDAKKMLQFLSGQTHSVATGVSISFLEPKTNKKKQTLFVDQTFVTFDPISPDLLDYYVKSGEPMDKAGSYGIQGEALTFISAVRGSYSNVVGLPLSLTLQELKKLLGYEGDQSGKWRELFA